MRISRENPNPGVWFEMEDGGAEVCIRLCSQRRLMDIRKATVKKRVEYKKGNRFPYEDLDDEKFNHLLWQDSIVDWRGIYDADTEEEIKCTDENKVFLCENSVQFLAFFTEKLEELRETYQTDMEEEEKN